MTTITQHRKPDTLPRHQAQDIAADNGFNCYSKPYGMDAPKDHVTDTGEVFYFRWHSKGLEVIILTGADNDQPANEIINGHNTLFK